MSVSAAPALSIVYDCDAAPLGLIAGEPFDPARSAQIDTILERQRGRSKLAYGGPLCFDVTTKVSLEVRTRLSHAQTEGIVYRPDDTQQIGSLWACLSPPAES